MPIPVNDRPLEKVKEEVIDQLILNYSHGELSSDAFERRLDSAYNCENAEQLQALVADLPLQSDPRYHTEKAARMQPKYTASSSVQNTLKVTSILSSDHRSGEWIVPKDIYLNNYLGSVELDFRDAVFTHPEVTIHLNCVMGSDDIIVPSNMNVTTHTTNILGSVSHNRVRLAETNLTSQQPSIHIVGKVILGSVDISVKQSVKKQLKQFANSLKELFTQRKAN